ncbi:hypothetical protein HPS26_12125 [Klebsiella aerogenes]|uniref:hypothetical protein n=1 Tax=Klebsiella aerogenes TaxID=548 RepID=UPI000D958A24|nr:hypothetical protein [Klebsiella aerogenes]EIV2085265.1 hypothetical protein [Klebsiella aerogenes]EIW9213506.1 hypothetical protein [Klebsiella aerogenes]NPD50767.1 hypothetical protein [Klebsiella aerogenes]NPD77940.1 hypothetical protein [Klebsiella aerogenes]PYZ47710.1 hypothetical protein DNK66_18375 [Klebsiella aerogenes]
MGFPSPATDYIKRTLTVDLVYGTGPNPRTVETATGYVVVDVSMKPRQGSTVMITYDGITDFAKVMGRSLITKDGEAIEGETLNDVVVFGVVTFIIPREHGRGCVSNMSF